MGSRRSGLRVPQEVPDPGESEGESVSSLADSPRSRISIPGGPDATSAFSQAIGVTRGRSADSVSRSRRAQDIRDPSVVRCRLTSIHPCAM
jgi:hypothetical protein